MKAFLTMADGRWERGIMDVRPVRASPVPCFSARSRTGMSAVSSAAPSMRT